MAVLCWLIEVLKVHHGNTISTTSAGIVACKMMGERMKVDHKKYEPQHLARSEYSILVELWYEGT